MKLSEFDYDLPPELIAQAPADSRSDSRLMLVDRRSASIEHRFCRELPDILSSSDLLVLNDTRVFPARLIGTAKERSFEVFLVSPMGGKIWEVLLRPARRAPAGTRIIFEKGVLEGIVEPSAPGRTKRVRFEWEGDFWQHLDRLGQVPLPPYIARGDRSKEIQDRERYQTVFARHRGSIAAPTAGLHFTPDMLRRIHHCFLTLHVGYGTFQPISSKTVEEHQMSAEHYRIDEEAADRIEHQRNGGKRIVAVGSTTTRVLEHLHSKFGEIRADQDWTDLFILPGHQFGVVGALMTNFHLPRSTLLVLVAAFAGTEFILECYRKAIESRYRFYSYGDAMLIV